MTSPPHTSSQITRPTTRPGLRWLGRRVDPRFGEGVVAGQAIVQRALADLAPHIGRWTVGAVDSVATVGPIACVAACEATPENGQPHAFSIGLPLETARTIADQLLTKTTLARGTGALTSSEMDLLRWLFAAMLERIETHTGCAMSLTNVVFGKEAEALVEAAVASVAVTLGAGKAKVLVAAQRAVWDALTLSIDDEPEESMMEDPIAVQLELPRRVAQQPTAGDALLLGGPSPMVLSPWQLTDGGRYRFAAARVVDAQASAMTIRPGDWDVGSAFGDSGLGVRHRRRPYDDDAAIACESR